MASGWAPEGAVQDQIDASIDDAVEQARRQLPSGPGLEYCEDCNKPIPEARRAAIAGVRLCIQCQTEQEKHQVRHSLINRRGSKDSQLR